METVQLSNLEIEIKLASGEYAYPICDVIVECGMQDQGIGAYEFWGARGNDVDMQFVVDSVKIEKITMDDEVLTRGTNAEIDEIFQRVEDYCSSDKIEGDVKTELGKLSDY